MLTENARLWLAGLGLQPTGELDLDQVYIAKACQIPCMFTFSSGQALYAFNI